jgi:hypothetical protein
MGQLVPSAWPFASFGITATRDWQQEIGAGAPHRGLLRSYRNRDPERRNNPTPDLSRVATGRPAALRAMHSPRRSGGTTG